MEKQINNGQLDIHTVFLDGREWGMNINKKGKKKVFNLNIQMPSDDNYFDGLMRNLSYCKKTPFKIALFYIIAASLWIIFSDILAERLSHKLLSFTTIQTYKGWFFVIVTAYMLYMLINKYTEQNLRYLNWLNNKHKQLESVYKELFIKENELQEKYTLLKKNEDALRISEERYKSIVEGTSDAIWEWDYGSQKLYLSGRAEEMLGYNIKDGLKIDEVWDALIHPEDRIRVERDIENCKEGKTLYCQTEFRIKQKSGGYVWVLLRGKVISGADGKPVKLLGSVTDIQERRIMEEQLMHMAYYDMLTDLPNRLLFMERLKEELAASKVGKKGSVLFVNIDDLKGVNNTLGYDYGDQLLKLIAENMKNSLSDNDMICRFGGNEFIVLHPGIENNADSTKLADSILGIFENPFEIGNKEIYVTVSIGIGIYPDDGTETETILKNAGAAVNKAKAAGKNRYYI